MALSVIVYTDTAGRRNCTGLREWLIPKTIAHEGLRESDTLVSALLTLSLTRHCVSRSPSHNHTAHRNTRRTHLSMPRLRTNGVALLTGQRDSGQTHASSIELGSRAARTTCRQQARALALVHIERAASGSATRDTRWGRGEGEGRGHRGKHTRNIPRHARSLPCGGLFYHPRQRLLGVGFLDYAPWGNYLQVHGMAARQLF